MTDLIVVPKATEWRKLKALVLDSVSSPITKRVYNLGLDEFFDWYGQEPRPGFTKATVSVAGGAGAPRASASLRGSQGARRVELRLGVPVSLPAGQHEARSRARRTEFGPGPDAGHRTVAITEFRAGAMPGRLGPAYSADARTCAPARPIGRGA
jgi:hypothetical protein